MIGCVFVSVIGGPLDSEWEICVPDSVPVLGKYRVERIFPDSSHQKPVRGPCRLFAHGSDPRVGAHQPGNHRSD
jgi:hypothetical protein